MERKLPQVNSPEALEFCEKWDAGTHFDKLDLCNKTVGGISYQMGKDFRSACRVKELPPHFKDVKSKTWDEHLDIISSMDDLISYHQRVPTEITISIDTEIPIGIVYTSDWHLGMFGVDYDSFRKDIKFIKEEDGFFCEIGGDGYHNIIQPSKLGSSHNQIPIGVQKGTFVLTLKELKDIIKAIRTGNHNYWTALAEGEDWDKELAQRMKLVYLKHYARIYWKIGDMIYPELALHKGRFNSAFNLTHICKQYQRMYFPDSRIVVVEHQHIADVESYKYNENECVAIRPGTYAIYDDFAQQGGYFGQYVANPTVIMYPNEDKLVAFKDMRDAAIYLRSVRGGRLIE